jgi:flagellar motor switch/type III secretory pathway protein FliN
VSKRAEVAAPRRALNKTEQTKASAEAPTKRLTVDIPESLHTRIRVACARNKLQMKELVVQGIDRVLEQYE